MTPQYDSPNVNMLAARWWVLVVRGIAAILFGVLAFKSPATSLLALVVLWGAYALVDGVFNILLAIRGARAGGTWGWLLAEGVLSVAAGLAAFAWPGMTALVLLTIIAVWAILTGVAEIAAAIRLRRQITGEWMLATSGVLSIAFGVLLFLYPGTGALAVVWMIGAYAILFGVLLIALGMRLNRWRRGTERPTFPPGGRATTA